jgi:DNA helicase-2/ATP-dependent DNA helicase PcrA
MFVPRPQQREVLNYRGGWMGVSAVPGSGKTLVLSHLGAELLSAGLMRPGQEILVVTLLNSAVENLTARLAAILEAGGLSPNQGYRVRTLHGLAHDILRERPGLAGLAEDFEIVDERISGEILEEVTQAWLDKNPTALEAFLDPDLRPERLKRVRAEQAPDLVNDLASRFIRSAKDVQLSPGELRQRLDTLPVRQPLAEMGWAIYDQYQRALGARGAIDFDDLIRFSLQVLSADPAYLERLRRRWPYILEDEAQDSSHLQEIILRTLSGPGGNWVRVGDPNQSVFETFTTASQAYLRSFMEAEGVLARFLPNTGRFTLSIMRLANRLIEWVSQEHPNVDLRGALASPFIQPVPSNDQQQNPPDRPEAVRFVARRLNPGEEIRFVAESLARWLPEHPDKTVAVLVPRNQTGFEMVKAVRRRQLAFTEALLSSSSTRQVAASIGAVIAGLAEPDSPATLATAYWLWWWNHPEETRSGVDAQQVRKLLGRCRRVEEYLWPSTGRDWLEGLSGAEVTPEIRSELAAFREQVRSWQGMALLPVDQLVLRIAQDLFREASLLATAYKLAGVLREASLDHPEWRLSELNRELAAVAQNERRFLGFSDEETGIDPESFQGRVLITTIHRAKGLEWDRVYLMSVNNYEFPSGEATDRYIFEPWYLREHLNLPAEALAQLRAAAAGDYLAYEPSAATRQARLDYAAERLRLLYVGLTRARQELIVTWNTGRSGDLTPALPFLALQEFTKEHLHQAKSGQG